MPAFQVLLTGESSARDPEDGELLRAALWSRLFMKQRQLIDSI